MHLFIRYIILTIYYTSIRLNPIFLQKYIPYIYCAKWEVLVIAREKDQKECNGSEVMLHGLRVNVRAPIRIPPSQRYEYIKIHFLLKKNSELITTK